MFSASDHQFMARALQLAQRGRFTTAPNPNVGCVIVDRYGQVVGEGWHRRAGTPHAEVHALNAAGAKASGATAYVTLEPCSHYGRTPPCADALIAAGVSRVVSAMKDPNPLVAGKGLSRMADAGIDVQSGLLEEQAEALNRGFLTRMRLGRPFITLKMASSLDGKTALNNGQSKWITGPLARCDVQRHRAASCAILSGSGTVIADNPSLNVRPDELGPLDLYGETLRQPLRVILDGRNQLVSGLKVFSTPDEVLVINREGSNQDFGHHVRQWQGPSIGNKLDLNQVVNYLGEQQINYLWVEAGSRLAGALLKEKLIDELILYVAPKLMGEGSQGLFSFDPLSSMRDVVDLSFRDIRNVGDDIRITADMRYPPLQEA